MIFFYISNLFIFVYIKFDFFYISNLFIFVYIKYDFFFFFYINHLFIFVYIKYIQLIVESKLRFYWQSILSNYDVTIKFNTKKQKRIKTIRRYSSIWNTSTILDTRECIYFKTKLFTWFTKLLKEQNGGDDNNDDNKDNDDDEDDKNQKRNKKKPKIKPQIKDEYSFQALHEWIENELEENEDFIKPTEKEWISIIFFIKDVMTNNMNLFIWDQWWNKMDDDQRCSILDEIWLSEVQLGTQKRRDDG